MIKKPSIGIVLYDIPDLVDILEVTTATVRKMIKEGRIKAKKHGRRWYVSDQSINEYFASSDNV